MSPPGRRRRKQARNSPGSMVGRSPWTLTTTFARPSGQQGQNASNAVGPRTVINPRHPAQPPAFHSRRKIVVVGRNHRRPNLAASARRAPAVNRQSCDVGQRFFRANGSSAGGRDQDQNVVKAVPSRRSILTGNSSAKLCLNGGRRAPARYTGCQRRGKPGICAPPQPPAAQRPPLQQPWSANIAMDSSNSTTRSSVPFSAPVSPCCR